jgi:hypothetical protein
VKIVGELSRGLTALDHPAKWRDLVFARLHRDSMLESRKALIIGGRRGRAAASGRGAVVAMLAQHWKRTQPEQHHSDG